MRLTGGDTISSGGGTLSFTAPTQALTTTNLSVAGLILATGGANTIGAGIGVINVTSTRISELIVDVDGSSSTLSLNGVISNGTVLGTASLTKAGFGTVILGNTGNLFKAMNIDSGTVSVANDTNLGALVAATFSGNSTDGNGTLQFTGNTTIGSTRLMNINLGATATFDVLTNSVTITSTISGAGGVIVSSTGGGGGLTLMPSTPTPEARSSTTAALTITGSGALSGTSGVTVTGTLNLSSSVNVLASTASLGLAASGAVVNVSTSQTIGSLTGTAGTVNLGSGAVMTLGAGSFGGAINGAGSLISTGGVTLSSATGSGFSGGTTINGGVLFISNTSNSALGSRAVAVNLGGTLATGATASVAGLVTVAGGGALTVNGSNGGTATLAGGLTLNAGSVLNLGGTNASMGQINLTTGVLTLGSGVETINVSGSVTTAGDYKLIGYGSTSYATSFNQLSLNTSSLTIGGSFTVSLVDNTTSHEIDLHVATVTATPNGLLTWTDATTNNTWDKTSVNWLDAGSSGAVAYADGNTVTFTDTGATTVNLSNSGVALAPAAMTVTNSGVNTYTLTGDGINSPGALTKLGTGALILANATDSFAGGITVTSGSFVVATTGSLASTQSLTIGASAVVTFSNSGQSLASVTTSGALTFSTTSGTIGTLSTSSTATTTFSAAGTVTALTGAGTIRVSSTLNVAGGSFSGAIGLTGDAGSLVMNGPGTLTLTGSASSYLGSTTVNGGTLAVANLGNGGAASGIGASSSLASSLVINGGVLQYTGAAVGSTDRLFTVGANGATINNSTATANTFSFANTAAIAFANSSAAAALTLTGSNAGANIFAPIIGDSGTGANVTSVYKTGAGEWEVTGVNTYTGGTTLSGGLLFVNAASAFGATPTSSTTANINVIGNSTISFNGTGVTLEPTRTIAIANGVTLTLGAYQYDDPRKYHRPRRHRKDQLWHNVDSHAIRSK